MKCSLNALLGWPGPLTHRQFLAWQAWLAEEWNRPNRSDHYVMQASFETRYRGVKHRPRNHDEMRIPFVQRQERAEEQEPLTAQEASERSQSVHIAAMGGKVRRMRRMPDGSVVEVKE